MGVSVKESLAVTIEGKKCLEMLKDLISCGDSFLDDVDKQSWGKKLPETKEFAKKLLNTLETYEDVKGFDDPSDYDQGRM